MRGCTAGHANTLQLGTDVCIALERLHSVIGSALPSWMPPRDHLHTVKPVHMNSHCRLLEGRCSMRAIASNLVGRAYVCSFIKDFGASVDAPLVELLHDSKHTQQIPQEQLAPPQLERQQHPLLARQPR